MHDILIKDCEYISKASCIPWDRLKNKTILITGASGLIGKNLLHALLYSNKCYDLKLKILALVRNHDILKKEIEDKSLFIIEGTVENLPKIDSTIDYVIHGASPTASAFFVSNPVDTIHTAVFGTDKLLQLAVQKQVKEFIYLSSMEVYGKNTTEKLLKEDDLGYLDILSVRNCYPISKRLCENLCVCYNKQNGINTKSVRLAQTFGPGVSYNDVRVFAMMARCAINKEDIILQTKGESKHSYLYTADAVTGILCVLLKGENGKSYNLANPNTYCSIYEMAKMVATKLASNKISVRVAEKGDISKYPASSFINLDISLAKSLGWKANIDLVDMYKKMIVYMEK